MSGFFFTPMIPKQAQMIVASTSTLHGEAYLAYLDAELVRLWEGVDTVLFVPFARPGGMSHQANTDKVGEALARIGKKTVGLHEFDEPQQAILEAQAIFVGGGNTFVLVNTLCQLQLWEPLRQAIAQGTPYLGCSAGSNITGLSVHTTNDMPIVHPPSLEALGILPFCINPHYLDPQPGSTHMGETRETRIREFHTQHATPVLGLREGSWLSISQGQAQLCGPWTARWFEPEQPAVEQPSGTIF